MRSAALLRALPLAVAVIGISACSTTGTVKPHADAAVQRALIPVHPSATHLADSIAAERVTTVSKKLAVEGIKALDKGEFEKANALFNLALKTDINNSFLHFVNGLTYHLRALAGEGTLYALAQQGYEMAVQFDPSNAIARNYLGLLFLDRRQFSAAKGQLMEAALYAPDDADLLYDLAVAAYYAKDPRVAYAALEGAERLSDGAENGRTLRALAIVAAASGDDLAARDFLAQLARKRGTDDMVRYTEKRVASWWRTYQSGFVKAQFGDGANDGYYQDSQQGGGYYQNNQQYDTYDPYQNGAGQADAASGEQWSDKGKSGFYEKNMVMLDVVIVSTQEDNNDTFGVNLLEGLRIQFGNTLGTPAVMRQTTENSDLINPAYDTSTRQVTRLIQIPSISYTLNIANAVDRSNEVLARPTLVALGGQTSTFFSGTDVIGAAVSTGQGGSVQVQKEAGVKLALTPEFLPDGLIKMKVIAERTFLTNPNSNVLFDFRLDTSKTLVSANVAMKFGETLILSGLSERNTESDNSGVPLLRDIPLVQYLFSRKSDRDFYKSVLILVTPRRPSYTNRAQEDIDAERAEMSEFERVQAEFEDKYKQWFKAVPNTAQAIASLERSPLFREFRSGDLEIESWTSRASHGGRLRSALKYLYY